MYQIHVWRRISTDEKTQPMNPNFSTKRVELKDVILLINGIVDSPSKFPTFFLEVISQRRVGPIMGDP